MILPVRASAASAASAALPHASARGLNSQLSQRDEELAGLRKELQDMKDCLSFESWST